MLVMRLMMQLISMVCQTLYDFEDSIKYTLADHDEIEKRL